MSNDPNIPEGMKRCPKCERVLPKTEFHRDKTNRDGLHCACKGCRKEIDSAWYKANLEKVKSSCSAWRRANSEKMKSTRSAWDKANPEKIKSYRRRWDKANPEKVKELETQRRAQQQKDLTPGAVKNQIVNSMRYNGIYISRSSIPEDLIQAKREQLKLARAIRALKQETKNAR